MLLHTDIAIAPCYCYCTLLLLLHLAIANEIANASDIADDIAWMMTQAHFDIWNGENMV